MSVAESAIIKIAWAIAKLTINHQACPDAVAKAIPATALPSITKEIQFFRPTRKAISLPMIEAGTPKKLIMPAKVVIAKKKLLPEASAQNPKKATSQLREANSSSECVI